MSDGLTDSEGSKTRKASLRFKGVYPIHLFLKSIKLSIGRAFVPVLCAGAKALDLRVKGDNWGDLRPPYNKGLG
jgi:hypothetical protein